MAANSPHISLSAETLFSIGDFPITNSMLTSLIVSGILISFALVVKANLKDTDKPTGIQNFAEWVVEALYNLVHSVTQNNKKAHTFLPIVATFFLFILLNNWIGLLPGVGTVSIIKEETSHEEEVHATLVQTVHAAEDTPTEEAHLEILSDEVHSEIPHESAAEESHTAVIPIIRPGSADLNTTLALALISVIATQIFGVHYLNGEYFTKFFNFSSPIMFYVGLLELISEFAKIISFAFRLFGNIFAGEVLLVVISYLVPLVIPMPFYGLELFVGFIQALVFAMLSLVFFNMATAGHEH